MIVIFVDKVEDFIHFLDRRIMDEIFYEFNEPTTERDLTSKTSLEIILHFLAKLEEYIILYETKLMIQKSSSSTIDEEIIKTFQDVLMEADSNLKLVKGKIREIFLSYS